MKQILKMTALALVALAVPLFGWAAVASADDGNVRSGNNVVVQSDETIDHTLFAAGNTVEVAGTVDGDVFCAGQTVNITGTVRGDVICAGQTVNVNGTVEGDVRVAGQAVTLMGTVEGNATVGSQTLTTQEGSILKDLTLGTTQATLNGEVERDAYIGAESASINGKVGRNVTAELQTFTMDDNARVGGDVTYYSDSKLERSEGAQVVGQVDQREPQYSQQADQNGFTVGQWFGGVVLTLLVMLVLGLALAALFPRMLQHASEHAVKNPGIIFLIGLGVAILSPVFIIGVMLTGVGALLGLVLLFAYLLLMFISQPVAGYYVGRLILGKNTTNALLYMLLGVAILAIAYFIPILGGLVMFVAGMFGAGMVVRELIKRTGRPQYDVSKMNLKPAKAKK